MKLTKDPKDHTLQVLDLPPPPLQLFKEQFTLCLYGNNFHKQHEFSETRNYLSNFRSCSKLSVYF